MSLDDNLFTKEQNVHIYNRVILTVGIKKIRAGQHIPINKFNNILIYLFFFLLELLRNNQKFKCYM